MFSSVFLLLCVTVDPCCCCLPPELPSKCTSCTIPWGMCSSSFAGERWHCKSLWAIPWTVLHLFWAPKIGRATRRPCRSPSPTTVRLERVRCRQRPLPLCRPSARWQSPDAFAMSKTLSHSILIGSKSKVFRFFQSKNIYLVYKIYELKIY